VGTVARSATTGTDLSIGDVVSPNLCNREVCTSVVVGAGGQLAFLEHVASIYIGNFELPEPLHVLANDFPNLHF
jgi:hypothetical protein